MTYLHGFAQAIQEQIRRDADGRRVVERVKTPGGERHPRPVRAVVGRTLVSAGLHLMGDSERLRDAA